MSVNIVVGAQWGDEGKGKIVDLLSERADWVVRYQGGANAGHTIKIAGNEYVLHLIPSGMLHPDVKCVIGNGVVLDPVALLEELEFLAEKRIDVQGRLFISDRAHLVLSHHKMLDRFQEDQSRDKKIGTTCRGIGPAYVEKYERSGIRVGDLLDESTLKSKMLEKVQSVNRYFRQIGLKQELDPQKELEQFLEYRERLLPFIADTGILLWEAVKKGQKILLEGAQGTLLDVDHGTYPFVTSSNPTSGGACVGSGIPPTKIDSVTGVLKAYTTRVGEGPFPTELLGADGEKLREIGGEFGATTGRPRRCGWFDLVIARYAARINGLTEIALTKLDVLDKFDTIKICTAYKLGGELIEEFPASVSALEECEPVYHQLPGWNSDTSEAREWDDLPANARRYIEFIESALDVPVKIISVGPGRSKTILKR
ncbi:MAG: adenylosuccinate synthase [Calditrichia bacterium]